MLNQKQAEEAIVATYNETDNDGNGQQQSKEAEEDDSMFNVKSFLWHGGSAYDAWFSCASNQVTFSFLQPPHNSLSLCSLTLTEFPFADFCRLRRFC